MGWEKMKSSKKSGPGYIWKAMFRNQTLDELDELYNKPKDKSLFLSVTELLPNYFMEFSQRGEMLWEAVKPFFQSEKQLCILKKYLDEKNPDQMPYNPIDPYGEPFISSENEEEEKEFLEFICSINKEYELSPERQ